MRTTLTLLLGAGATIASAQLVNGSFEDGLNGWFMLPGEFGSQPLEVMLDAAPGQGDRSLEVPAIFDVAGTQNRALQQLPQFSAGDVLYFGGWIRNLYISSPQGTIQLCYCDSSTIHSMFGPLLGSTAMSWSYFEGTWTVPDPQISGTSVCASLNGGTHGGGSGAIGGAWFDGLFVEMDPSTALHDLPEHGLLPFRPNPANDKLWIDLPETAISILAIDASGRAHDLKNFTHRDRTMEVDVRALPVGICLLRITTASGTHAVRFVKA